ncbi:MAG: HEPN domain-containing protein [bacterium]|nr:HEPN domain-containing protein [bacterium]
MLSKSQVRLAIVYWAETANHDYDTMLGLFRIKRYSDCLFFGHIVLEKILKALVVQCTNDHSPKIHDLVRLQELAGVALNDDSVGILKEINNFNLATRYPDYKLNFYKKCDKDFSKEYLEKIKKIYKKLCLEIK